MNITYEPKVLTYKRSVDLETKLSSQNFFQKNKPDALWIVSWMRFLPFMEKVLARQICFEMYWPLGAYCPNIYTVLLQQKEEDETEVDYRSEDGNNNMLQASTVSNRWDPVLWYSRHGYNVSEMIKAPGKVHIFWEGYKILRNLHLTFVLCGASQK